MQVSNEKPVIPITSWLERNYGKVHRIPHIFDTSGKEVNLPHSLKRIWLSKNGNSPVFHICGELSSIFTVEKTLEKHRRINLLIANELINKDTRDRLANLLEKNTDLLKVYSVEKRPDMHGTLIDNNMFIEDWHDFGKDYGFGTVIEDAKKNMLDDYLNYFNDQIKNHQPLNPDQIRSIPIKPVST